MRAGSKIVPGLVRVKLMRGRTFEARWSGRPVVRPGLEIFVFWVMDREDKEEVVLAARADIAWVKRISVDLKYGTRRAVGSNLIEAVLS